MTITLDNVETLLDNELNKREADLEATRQEIKDLELKIKERKAHVEKLSFYVDKFSKVTSIIEMDKKSKKSFEEIHKGGLSKSDNKLPA